MRIGHEDHLHFGFAFLHFSIFQGSLPALRRHLSMGIQMATEWYLRKKLQNAEKGFGEGKISSADLETIRLIHESYPRSVKDSTGEK